MIAMFSGKTVGAILIIISVVDHNNKLRMLKESSDPMHVQLGAGLKRNDRDHEQ